MYILYLEARTPKALVNSRYSKDRLEVEGNGNRLKFYL